MCSFFPAGHGACGVRKAAFRKDMLMAKRSAKIPGGTLAEALYEARRAKKRCAGASSEKEAYSASGPVMAPVTAEAAATQGLER